MKNTTTITIGNDPVTYTVAELNVGEIDAVLGSINVAGPLHRTYNVLGYDVTPEFAAASSGCAVERQGELSVADLDALVAAVAEVNARFLSRIVSRAAESSLANSATSARSSATTPAP